MARKRCEHVVVLLLLLGHAGLLAWSATRHSPSIDEVGHLPAGLSHWHLGRFDLYRVNPPLIRLVAALPVLLARPATDWSRLAEGDQGRPEFRMGEEFIAANVHLSFWYFTLARWSCIPFSLLGGFICFLWARDLYGRLAGFLALTLWCFCPNVLGNAQMITPDVGAAALGVTAGYTFWRWLRRPRWSRAAVAGIILGLAELTKTTWIVFFGLWPLLWLAWRWTNSTHRAFPRLACRSEIGQLGFLLLLAFYTLNLGYGFEGSFEPLGHYDFVSDLFRGPKLPMPQSRNRFQSGWVGSVPVPLPRHYLLGIDRQRMDFERTIRSYLRGEWRQGGWWYYYLYGLAVKVPLGTWLILLLAGSLTLLGRVPLAAWRDEMVMLAPAAAVLILVSSQTGFNHHLRYVLPAFPFAFVWASKVAQTAVWKMRYAPAVVCGGLLWSVSSSLAVYPHSLAYFNEAAGGPMNGHAHLVDSNIDWGQDLLYLKRWLDEHPEARPLGLAYFGHFDPRVAGVEFSLPPKNPTTAQQATAVQNVLAVGASVVGLVCSPRGPAPFLAASALFPGRTSVEDFGPHPGWYAVSVGVLRGLQFPLHDGRGKAIFVDGPWYTYFQRLRPVATAGYSIYIYHIDLEEANRVRQELGLPLLPAHPGASSSVPSSGGG